jgi:hypothetical protein
VRYARQGAQIVGTYVAMKSVAAQRDNENGVLCR